MNKSFSEKSRRRDRLAEWFIKIGGILVIVSVVWILVMIARVALPLFYPPSAELSSTSTLPSQLKDIKIVASGVDDSRLQFFVLADNGNFHFIEATSGRILNSIKVPAVPDGATRVVSAEPYAKKDYNLLWDNGAVSSVSLSFETSRNDNGKTAISPVVTGNDDLAFAGNGPVEQSFVRRVEGKGSVRVDRLQDGHARYPSRLTTACVSASSSSRYSSPLRHARAFLA